MNASMSHLDGNAVAGELSRIFVVDITSAQGQCANCGAKGRFAESQVYADCPGLVARCANCEHVLLRLVSAGQRVCLDLSGMTYITFDTREQLEATS